MLDVALVSLIEDLIEKAGADGVIEFWQRVGENLANRIGKEAYMGWTSFNVAVREGRTAHSIAWCSFCVFHERFREEVAKNIAVAGNPLECLLLATRGFDGETRISAKGLSKININPEHVRALLRNYECVYALLMRGARLKEG